MVTANGFASSSWRQAFADALIRLRPDLNPDALDELSDSAYMRLAEMDPGNAAALCSPAADGPPSVPGDAARGAGKGA